jgi:hypothetical protein
MAIGKRRPGTVIALQGNVVDVRFDGDLPPLRQELVTREPDRVVMEVANHLDSRTVRCIALSPTRGLARGAAVVDTEGPLAVPVGEALRCWELRRDDEVVESSWAGHWMACSSREEAAKAAGERLATLRAAADQAVPANRRRQSGGRPTASVAET